MRMNKAVCTACRHRIDAAARLCPYCGADPQTGARVDTQAILEEVLAASESVREYARQRQRTVIAATSVLVFLILAGLHQFATMRNDSAVTSQPAVPLTEVTDLSNQRRESDVLPVPDLDFQYEGRSQAMRTFIPEPGAVPPPQPGTAPAAR